MTSINIYHYVYRITNIIENRHYYGKRSSKIEPKLDIGKKYFSSSKNKQFIQDQKENPQNYKYKIVKIFNDIKSALKLESKLHYKFDVGKNPKFYNKVKQSLNGFDSTGKILIIDDNGFKIMISCDKYNPNKHKTISSGKVAVKDKNGNCFLVSKNDPRYLNGELIFIACGRIISEDHKKKLSLQRKGIPRSLEICKKMSDTMTKNKTHVGQNNSRFKYFYHTPWGVFDTPAALLPDITLTKMKNFCINSDRILKELVFNNCPKLQSKFNKSDIGKTYKELGFWVEQIS